MKKNLLFITFIIALFLGCKKDQLITTDISVISTEPILYWDNGLTLDQQIDSILVYNYGNATENELNKTKSFNSDTTLVTVSILVKSQYKNKIEDGNLTNNTAQIELRKETDLFSDNLFGLYNDDIYTSIHNSLVSLDFFDLSTASEIDVPVNFHIYNGVQIANSELNEAINYMNQKFLGTKINFVLCGTNYISVGNGHHNMQDESIANNNDVSNTLNIHVVKSITGNDPLIQGYAYFPYSGKERLFIRKEKLDKFIFIHELGHFFSLYHTFENDKYNSSTIPPGMSGCYWEGDGICQTPQTSEQGGLNLCSGSNIVNRKNYMSYTITCEKQFEQEQIKRIAFSARNHYNFTNCGGGGNNISTISLSGNLNFGNVQINTSSNPKTLTVSNTGNAPFSITNISLPNGYSITQGPYQPIAPNNSLNLTVVFNPTNTQTYNGNITVQSTADNGNNTIAVTGTGTNAGSNNSIISLSGNLNFGTVDIGNSGTQSFTISNNGNTSFSVNSITSSNSAFTISGWTSGVINANGSKTVNVTFTPTNAQSYNSTITVNSTADNNAGNNTLSANGVGQTVVTNQPNLVFHSFEIDDDNSGTSSGDDDGVAEAGEEIELNVFLENIGNGDANNVDVILELTTPDPDITITDNDRFYGTINAGTIDDSPDFDFEIDANCPTKNVTFTLQITSDEGNWTRTFTVPIQGSSGGSNPISITPNNSCSSAPLMQVNTDYTVTVNTANYALYTPTGGESYQGADIRGFWLKFDVPSSWTNNNRSISISNVSSNFDPVISVKTVCSSTFYLYQPNTSLNYGNFQGLGSNEAFLFNPNAANTFYVRIYHYYGNQTPTVSFDIRVD